MATPEPTAEELAERLMAIRAEFPTTARLVDEVHRLRVEVDELLAELDGRDEKARKRWIKRQQKQLRLRSVEFRAGRWEMSLEGAREMGAAYVAMAKSLLGDGPNYSETKLSFDVKIAESPEVYTLVVQRHAPGALTPHEARQLAEKARDDAHAELYQLRNTVTRVNGLAAEMRTRRWPEQTITAHAADALDHALNPPEETTP